MRRCRLGGDGGVSALLLHFGAQFLLVQVAPGWRRRRAATLLRTSVLKSCRYRCRLEGDGGVWPRCVALQCSNPACAGVARLATAACSHAASHFGAQILHRAGVVLMVTAAYSHAASHSGAQILQAQVSPGWRRRRVATLLRTSVLKSCTRRCRLGGDGGVTYAAAHFGAQILHAQASP